MLGREEGVVLGRLIGGLKEVLVTSGSPSVDRDKDKG